MNKSKFSVDELLKSVVSAGSGLSATINTTAAKEEVTTTTTTSTSPNSRVSPVNLPPPPPPPQLPLQNPFNNKFLEATRGQLDFFNKSGN